MPQVHGVAGQYDGGNGCKSSWPESWSAHNIALKELAVAVWGHHWAGKRACCYSDNTAVVFAINKGSARDPQLMRLLRTLFFLCASFNMTVVARHVPGALNSSADALSRNNQALFLALNLQASQSPKEVPAALQNLVFRIEVGWTSAEWTKLFKLTLQRMLPPLH